MATPPTFSVVVPTHRRPEHLQHCLDGLERQTLPPFEVIVVRTHDDEPTAAVVRAHPGVIDETITRPSNTAGLERGAMRAGGDVVCLIDDDAIARPDWLERMAAHFADDRVGAVGGRDVQPGIPASDGVPVGRITRWGRLVGNHHVGSGSARHVDVLKGVNMAFRRDLLALPIGLRGGSTQDHFEIAMGLWIARLGRVAVYDPHVSVDHHPAPRADGSRRFSPDPQLARASAFNLVHAIVSLRPDLAVRRGLFGVLVGDRGCPGLLRAGVAVTQRDRSVYSRLIPSLRGQAEALREAARGRPLQMRRIAGDTVVTTGRTRRHGR